MANKYPYVASAGPLVKMIEHLKKAKFPAQGLTARTLKKLGVAPNNESYVLNVLRFLDFIDDDGNKKANVSIFSQHDEGAFASGFAKIVRSAYDELFQLHGDGAWELDRDALIQFFRTSDHSSHVVGTRQAATFVALAGLSGHAEIPSTRSAARASPRRQSSERKAKGDSPPAARILPAALPAGGSVGLTVRVEVNLPAAGDQGTYDRIFRSIRENLIDAR